LLNEKDLILIYVNFQNGSLNWTVQLNADYKNAQTKFYSSDNYVYALGYKNGKSVLVSINENIGKVEEIKTFAGQLLYDKRKFYLLKYNGICSYSGDFYSPKWETELRINYTRFKFILNRLVMFSKKQVLFVNTDTGEIRGSIDLNEDDLECDVDEEGNLFVLTRIIRGENRSIVMSIRKIAQTGSILNEVDLPGIFNHIAVYEKFVVLTAKEKIKILEINNLQAVSEYNADLRSISYSESSIIINSKDFAIIFNTSSEDFSSEYRLINRFNGFSLFKGGLFIKYR